MSIVKYVQGSKDNKTDQKLYGLIGKFSINSKVHDELSVPVTGNDGDHWYIWLDVNGKPYGFCNVRIGKNKTDWHIRLLYAEGLVKIRNDLIEFVLEDARRMDCKTVYTNDRETAGIWKLFNFVPGEKKRGSFVKWEKVL